MSGAFCGKINKKQALKGSLIAKQNEENFASEFKIYDRIRKWGQTFGYKRALLKKLPNLNVEIVDNENEYCQKKGC